MTRLSKIFGLGLAGDYRLCIVTGCPYSPFLSDYAFNLINKNWIVEDGSALRRVAIKKLVAAQVTLT